MDKTTKFIADNAKTIFVIVGFLIGLYVQYQINVAKIAELENECVRLNSRLDASYSKLDAIKLDKSVFEASSKQWTMMSEDIREIRKSMDSFMQSEHMKQHYQ